MKNDNLAMSLDQSDDRTPAHFTASTGSGGDTNAGHQAAPVLVKIEGFETEAGSLHKQAEGFADIQGAAAPKCDHGIAAPFFTGPGRLNHILLGGIRFHVREELPMNGGF